MTLADSIALADKLAAADERVTKAERSALQARDELGRVKRANAADRSRLDELEDLLSSIQSIHPEDFAIVPWSKPPKNDDIAHGTAVLMLSDLHLDEIVNPLEMNHKNAYNRRIAEMRLERVIDSVVKLLRQHEKGIHLDGLVVALLGDVITGIIHAELERTNEAPIAATIAYWVPILAGAFVFLADELDVPVVVNTVDGNHDRSYAKPQAKQRAVSSNAFIIYNWLADSLRADDRITFNISVSPHSMLEVYDTDFLLAHGDGFRSQGGVGGLYPSMLKYLLRLHELYTFDHALFGHWHSTHWHRDAFVNGTCKGIDEWALSIGFKDERPSQSLFLVTPEHGVTSKREVFASSSAEGWQQTKKRRRP